MKLEPLFPAVPSVQWLRDLIEEMEDEEDRPEIHDKLRDVLWFLIWHRRHELEPGRPPRYGITMAFMRKYHHRIYGLEMLPFEDDLLEYARNQYEELKNPTVEPKR